MTESISDFGADDRQVWTDSLNTELIAVPDGPGDRTVRPISEAHRKDLEQRGLIPPQPPKSHE
jgi:hypothetical protein